MPFGQQWSRCFLAGPWMSTRSQQRPLPAAFASIYGAGASSFTAEGSFVLASVDGAFTELEANDTVIASNGFVGEFVEHTCSDPLVTPLAKRGVRHGCPRDVQRPPMRSR